MNLDTFSDLKIDKLTRNTPDHQQACSAFGNQLPNPSRGFHIYSI